MRPDRPAASKSDLPSRAIQALALSLLPLQTVMADAAPQAAAADGFVFDAKLAVLLVLAAGTGWLLRRVLRHYVEGADKLGSTKRDRLQPNL